MILIKIIKRFMRDVIGKTKNYYQLAILEKRHPSCHFYSGAKISNTVFGQYNTVFEEAIIDCSKIGSHTYIQKKTTIFNTEIGKYCSIAAGVSIGPGIHKTDGISTHPSLYNKSTPLKKVFSKDDTFISFKKTTLGNDVWVGEKAIIIDGVNIGNGAIIAAGSVVTKNVEPYAIVGGVPANLIRFRFLSETAEKINKSNWWLNSDEWIEQNYPIFANSDEFLSNLKKL